MMALSEVKGRGPEVAYIQCLRCAHDIYLEEQTYANYQGQVTCPECKGSQEVLIKEGALLNASLQSDIYEPIRDVVGHDIPTLILVDLAEATIDLGVNCFKSCVVMCRRCVQGVLLDQNIEDDALGKMIDAAKNKGILDERLYQTAKAIGFFGNSGAHPLDPELRKVEQLDASLALQVTKRFLKELYPVKGQEPSGEHGLGEEQEQT